MLNISPYLESNLRKTTRDFLNLFFDKGETICVSDCQGGYHSIPQEQLEGDITLISPIYEKEDRIITEYNIKLVAINPIEGWRRDGNVTSYRTFMIECDDMSIAQQWDYVNRMEFPYSYACYSGGKSIHFAVVLDHVIPSEDMYRYTYEWILNIMTQADQKTKNPSRSVRFPGNLRDGKEQKLMRLNKRTKLDDLSKWLNRYKELKPKQLINKPKNLMAPNIDGVKPWASKALLEGVHNMEGSRNQMWMSIACEFALNGYDLSDTIEYLGNFFNEQTDFRKREWLTAVKSGWSYADKISR
jgi:hypothetical protein